jgi:hypothetical protein
MSPVGIFHCGFRINFILININPLNMNAIRIFGAFLPCTLLILSSACSKDDPKPSNEEELITEVHLHFQKVDESQNPVGEELVFSWTSMESWARNLR